MWIIRQGALWESGLESTRGKSHTGGAYDHRQKGGGAALGMMLSSLMRTPNYGEIKAKADSILKRYAISRPPVPIKEIVERDGLNVVFVNFTSLSREVAGLTEFSKARLLVNSEDAISRQTFTIAHEFGHWVLHRDLFLAHPEKYSVLLRKQAPGKNSDPLEKEANAFAGNILVPMFLLAPIAEFAGVSELARMFAVSEETIEYRLKYV